jgi:pimeloyl-ACP methyl ester carboxylesterase
LRIRWFGLVLLGCVADSAHATVPLKDCQLESAASRGSAKARCGWYEVAENRAEPGGKRIRIHIAVIPALRKDALPDPLFVISGGPGQAASDFYISSAGAFDRLRRERDIVVIDQRGTGRSNRLDCELPDELETERFDAELIKRYTSECLAKLPGDPRHYGTSVAVRDLDEIRAALGYDKINLYGISYGTRVAQHYLRRYANNVRAVVLDGVVPTDVVLGPDIAPAAQQALDAILTRCDADTECARAFPRIKQDLRTLSERLSLAPIPITVADPRTAVAMPLDFGYMHMAVALRLHSYSDETASLLPFLIREAAENRPQALAAQALMVTRSLTEQMANGMHNAVVCTEDAPFIPANAAEVPAVRESYLRGLFVQSLRAMCSVWPRGTMDEDFHTPLESDVPTLILSGENDPVTPASYGERAIKGFRRGKHWVFPGQGHGQLTSTCGASLIRRFVEGGRADTVDGECVKRVVPASFMVDANGPSP